MKLVLWWEEEYVAAYRKSSGFLQKSAVSDQNMDTSGGCGGIVKASDPTKFVSLINKSAEQLLGRFKTFIKINGIVDISYRTFACSHSRGIRSC
jgi:hypothetical protein